MREKKHQHVHKYERGRVGKDHIIYKCMLPNCPHYLPHEYLALGRLCVCWGGCGDAVVISKEMVQTEMKHPMCDTCRLKRQEQRATMAEMREEI